MHIVAKKFINGHNWFFACIKSRKSFNQSTLYSAVSQKTYNPHATDHSELLREESKRNKTPLHHAMAFSGALIYGIFRKLFLLKYTDSTELSWLILEHITFVVKECRSMLCTVRRWKTTAVTKYKRLHISICMKTSVVENRRTLSSVKCLCSDFNKFR